MIEYKRGRKDSTDVSNRTTWSSRCGKFKVQECRSTLGERIRYYALRLSISGWKMLQHMKTYRTRKAAEKALNNWVKQGSKIPLSEKRIQRDLNRRKR